MNLAIMCLMAIKFADLLNMSKKGGKPSHIVAKPRLLSQGGSTLRSWIAGGGWMWRSRRKLGHGVARRAFSLGKD